MKKKFFNIFCYSMLIIIGEIIFWKIKNVISIKAYILLRILQFLYIGNNIINLIRIRKIENTNSLMKIDNKRLEKCFDDICSFRHDLGNIIQAMQGYILIHDWTGLENMFNCINGENEQIKNCLKINKNEINNPAIYSLINKKCFQANNLNIKMYVDVRIDLRKLNISDLDLCRILGILIDNAIEAASQCENKKIEIKFLYDKLNKRNLVIVENSYLNKCVDLDKIYKKGYSSKADKIYHGLGLWKVKQIINLHKNLQIYTNKSKNFKQQLEIY